MKSGTTSGTGSGSGSGARAGRKSGAEAGRVTGVATCRFSAELWRWEVQSAWFFVTVSDDASAMIRERPRPPRGFGSVRVRATIGSTTWQTSVFPTSTRGAYVLPVKKAVRIAEDLDEGETADVVLEVLE